MKAAGAFNGLPRPKLRNTMQPIYAMTARNASRYLISAYSVWRVGARRLIPGLSCARLALRRLINDPTIFPGGLPRQQQV